MGEENESKDTNVKATIDAVTGLVNAVPVYQDGLQPSVKQVGKQLETVAKLVEIAITPLTVLVWGYEKIGQLISSSVSEKLSNIPEENITTPPIEVAGPAIEALRFAAHNPNLRELYVNLLATAMDRETIQQAHPGFVEVLKNITGDEALLLKAFISKDTYPLIDVHSKLKEKIGFTLIYSNYSHLSKVVELPYPDLIPSYIDNLCRLGILKIPSQVYITAENTYEPLESDTYLDNIKQQIESEEIRKVEFERKTLRLTVFGNQFIKNVVNEKK